MDIPKLNRAEYRKFGITFGLIIGALFGLFFPWAFDLEHRMWPWIAAAVLIFWALVHPNSLKFIYYPWMRFALVLGFINTRIILGVVFYFIFMPVSLFFWITRKDPLNRRVYHEGCESYWTQSNKPDRKNVENLY